jgi:hypothetical protein
LAILRTSYFTIKPTHYRMMAIMPKAFMLDIPLIAYDQPPTVVHPPEAVFDFPALPIIVVYRQYAPLLVCHVAE